MISFPWVMCFPLWVHIHMLQHLAVHYETFICDELRWRAIQSCRHIFPWHIWPSFRGNYVSTPPYTTGSSCSSCPANYGGGCQSNMCGKASGSFCPKQQASSNPVHDDVIKWKHFPHYWPFVRGIHRWPGNSPHKGQWSGALMLSLICAWIYGWVNNREAGDLRRHWVHYNVTVMRCAVYPTIGCGVVIILSIFCKIPNKGHPIARPRGWAMGCLLWERILKILCPTS